MLDSDITVAMVNEVLPGTWRCRAITQGGQAQLDAQRPDRMLTILVGGRRGDVLTVIPQLLSTIEAMADEVPPSITAEILLGRRRTAT